MNSFLLESRIDGLRVPRTPGSTSSRLETRPGKEPRANKNCPNEIFPVSGLKLPRLETQLFPAGRSKSIRPFRSYPGRLVRSSRGLGHNLAPTKNCPNGYRPASGFFVPCLETQLFPAGRSKSIRPFRSYPGRLVRSSRGLGHNLAPTKTV